MIGLVLGLIPRWALWSISVPRCREWAKWRGADEGRIQFLGQRSGLVWPKGSIFEKTEFRPRKKTCRVQSLQKPNCLVTALTRHVAAGRRHFRSKLSIGNRNNAKYPYASVLHLHEHLRLFCSSSAISDRIGTSRRLFCLTGVFERKRLLVSGHPRRATKESIFPTHSCRFLSFLRQVP
jgi:hypothetical protein